MFPFHVVFAQPMLALPDLLSQAGLGTGELEADEPVGEASTSSHRATLPMHKVVPSVATGLAYRGLLPISAGINGDRTR